jgi:hypothetical protein
MIEVSAISLQRILGSAFFGPEHFQELGDQLVVAADMSQDRSHQRLTFTPGTGVDISRCAGSRKTPAIYSPPRTMAPRIPVNVRNRKRLGMWRDDSLPGSVLI